MFYFLVSGSPCTVPSSTNVTTAETSSTTEPDSPKTFLFLAIIGAMFGVLLLILSFYCFKREYAIFVQTYMQAGLPRLSAYLIA